MITLSRFSYNSLSFSQGIDDPTEPDPSTYLKRFNITIKAYDGTEVAPPSVQLQVAMFLHHLNLQNFSQIRFSSSRNCLSRRSILANINLPLLLPSDTFDQQPLHLLNFNFIQYQHQRNQRHQTYRKGCMTRKGTWWTWTNQWSTWSLHQQMTKIS
jgi:hypothetical protein